MLQVEDVNLLIIEIPSHKSSVSIRGAKITTLKNNVMALSGSGGGSASGKNVKIKNEITKAGIVEIAMVPKR
jgi:hypothetical protein